MKSSAKRSNMCCVVWLIAVLYVLIQKGMEPHCWKREVPKKNKTKQSMWVKLVLMGMAGCVWVWCQGTAPGCGVWECEHRREGCWLSTFELGDFSNPGEKSLYNWRNRESKHCTHVWTLRRFLWNTVVIHKHQLFMRINAALFSGLWWCFFRVSSGFLNGLFSLKRRFFSTHWGISN